MSPPGARSERLARVALLGSTLLVTATLLWPSPPDGGALAGPGLVADTARSLARVTYDDGYYYLEIARHVARGEGSSFDGLEPTNGYHPLWRLSAGQAWKLGLLLTALFLARLETLALGLLVCAAWAWRLRSDPARGATLARLLATLALALAAYVLVGTWLFERAWPVSAHMKREWSQALLLHDPVLARHGRVVAELVDACWPVFNQKRSLWPYLALGLFGPALLLARRSARPLLRGLMPLVAFAWLQYVAAVWLYHGGYAFQPWYYLAPAWLCCLLVAQAAERLEARWPRATRAGMALVGTALLAFSLHTAARARAERVQAGEPLHVAARWVLEHVPAGERVGAWNAGGTAFFSGRSVIGLDGLVNSWPYALRERFALCDYWRARGVRYLVDTFYSSDRFGFLGQPLPCLEGREPIWIGPRLPKNPEWRVEAYLLPP